MDNRVIPSNKLYHSSGILRYSIEEGQAYRVVVEDIDEDLVHFYRSLIPFWMPKQRPKFPPHITVVRIHKEQPVDLTHWGKHDGEKIDFLYEAKVYHGKVYYWLNIWCTRLEEIRAELGMPVTSPYTLPPEGFKKCFHCTIANKKS